MNSGQDKSPTVLAHDRACGNGDVAVPITDDCSRVLCDLQGEVKNKFAPKKADAEKLADVYQEIFSRTGSPGFQRRHEYVSRCGDYLEYHITERQARLHAANFCKDRLCPMCNWRRSLKIFGQVSRIMNQLEAGGYVFLFLTLTVRNCPADELPGTVQALYDGWRKMYHKAPVFRQRVAGSFRSLEVTRNQKTGEFHPHLHVVLAVSPDYFAGRNYMPQMAWAKLWRDCCGLDYNPVVDIRRIKSGAKGLAGAVAEVTKYAVKSADFLCGTMADRVAYVTAFLRALAGRRLCSYTGVFAKVRKQLALDDAENGDLLNVDGSDLRDDVAYMVVRYSWKSGVYVREIAAGDGK